MIRLIKGSTSLIKGDFENCAVVNWRKKILPTDSKLISEGEEVQYVIPDVVILEMIHEMRAVAFYLLVGRYRAEYYLAEALVTKRT